MIKQKEEEAQKKKSDLEIELLKRQQKLEQVGLEKGVCSERQGCWMPGKQNSSRPDVRVCTPRETGVECSGGCTSHSRQTLRFH